jgi:hypothetical protein
MIRPAKFGDIPRLTDLMREMQGRSCYAHCTLEEGRFKEICRQAIQAHGGSACLFVAERDGQVQGFVIGALERLYGIAKERYASDLLTYTAEGADARDGIGLYDALLAWAEEVAEAFDVVAIELGATDAVSDHQRTGRLLERKGLTQYGAIYRKVITRETSRQTEVMEA